MSLNSFKTTIVSCSFSLFRHRDLPFFQSEIKNAAGCLCGTLHETALNRKQLSVGFPVSWLESNCCSVKVNIWWVSAIHHRVFYSTWKDLCVRLLLWALWLWMKLIPSSELPWWLQQWLHRKLASQDSTDVNLSGEKTHTKEGLVKIGVGIGVMQWWAKECLELPETIWRKETLSSWP